MTRLFPYYISRALISLAVGSLFALSGLHWGAALFVGVLVFAFFVWVPSSGRYTVNPDQGATPLRRDECTQTIADKSARNAFIVTILALAGTTLYYSLIAPADVPIIILNLTCAVGILTYVVSDLWFRR